MNVVLKLCHAGVKRLSRGCLASGKIVQSFDGQQAAKEVYPQTSASAPASGEFMSRRLFSAVVLLVSSALHAAEIRGKVTNAIGGEALNQVDVAVLETKISTTTSSGGVFHLAHVAPG